MTEQKRVNVEEAAALLACSTHTIYRLIRNGTLRAKRRVGGRGWILEEADVRACLEEFKAEPPVRTRREASASHLAAVEELRRQGIG